MEDGTKILWMTIERHPESLKALIRARLNDAGFETHEVAYESIGDLKNVDLESVSGVLLAPARLIPVEQMARLGKCALVQIWSSGYDKFNLADARAQGLPVANNHGANATSVAEQTMLLMLGVSRRAPEMHERVTQGHWEGNDHGMASYSLNGKTLGIIGMGRIGSLVTTRSLAFGMDVIYSDPTVAQSEAPAGANRVDMDELLERSDYISLHLHHTPETRGMIESSAFARMTRQPFIINASRAELIDKDALLDALRTKQIKGLGLDAHYNEPTSADDELWSYSSVFTSPHVAGSTVDSYAETIDACIANIKRAIAGEKPHGLIT